MGMAVYITRESPMDPRLHQRKPKKRPTRKEIRSRVITPEVDWLRDEEELFHFLAFTPARHNFPMLSRWDPTGRPWCHTPDEIELIAAEVQRALLQVEPGSNKARMLEQLLSLAQRAVTEDLLMVILPD